MQKCTVDICLSWRAGESQIYNPLNLQEYYTVAAHKHLGAEISVSVWLEI